MSPLPVKTIPSSRCCFDSVPPELLLQIVNHAVPLASWHGWLERSSSLRAYSLVSSTWRSVSQSLLCSSPVLPTLQHARHFLDRLENDDDEVLSASVGHLRIGDVELFASWDDFKDVIQRCTRLNSLSVLNMDQVILAELASHRRLYFFHGCNLQFTAPPEYSSRPSPSPPRPPSSPLAPPPLRLALRFLSLSHSGLPLLIPCDSLPDLTHLSLYDVYRSYGLDDALDPTINDYSLLLRTLAPKLRAARLDLVLYPPFDFDTWFPTLSTEDEDDDSRGKGSGLELFAVCSYETPSIFRLLRQARSITTILADAFPLDRSTRSHLLGDGTTYIGHPSLRTIRFKRGPIVQDEQGLIRKVWGDQVEVVYESNEENRTEVEREEEGRFGVDFWRACQAEQVRVEEGGQTGQVRPQSSSCGGFGTRGKISARSKDILGTSIEK